MQSQEPYGPADDELGDLPPLPIPRPGAWVAAAPPTPAAATPPEPIASPSLGGSLGGGASFTAATEDAPGARRPDPRPYPAANASQPSHQAPDPAPPGPTAELPPATPVAIDADLHAVTRLPWELAAQITSGMLANPARAHASVKDAMGLFDQLLREMHAYARIAGDFDLVAAESARRRTHGEYFHGGHDRVGDPAATAAQPASPTPKPAPTQPRPAGDYRPIPPGARGPYAPGTMSGTAPPAEDVPSSEHGGRAA